MSRSHLAVNCKYFERTHTHTARATFPHVLRVAESAGRNGQMTNVCRVFNDKVGVVSRCTYLNSLSFALSSPNHVVPTHTHTQEIVERTGRNPAYHYQQLGCSQHAVAKMLHYARAKCLGKPFNPYGMARSILWPRQTDDSTFFCAGNLCVCVCVCAPIF